MSNWLVLTVNRGTECDARRDIANALLCAGIDDADLSVPLEYRTKADRKTLVRVVLLPGFVFMRSGHSDALGTALRAADLETGLLHVTGFISKVGDKLAPAEISDDAMSAFFDIIDRMNLAFVSILLDSKLPKRAQVVRYKHPDQGAFVKIVEGLTGEIVKSDKNRSIVGMQILGRLVEASVSTRQPLEVVA